MRIGIRFLILSVLFSSVAYANPLPPSLANGTTGMLPSTLTLPSNVTWAPRGSAVPAVNSSCPSDYHWGCDSVCQFYDLNSPCYDQCDSPICYESCDAYDSYGYCVGSGYYCDPPYCYTYCPPPQCISYTQECSCKKNSCFPSKTKLKIKKGDRVFYKSMINVRIGDEVEVSPNVFEPVITFAHRTLSGRAEFLKISTETDSVLLSPGHFIFRARNSTDQFNSSDAEKITFARDIQVGDFIFVKEGDSLVPRPVLKREFLNFPGGVYAPITKAGTLIVYHSSRSAGIQVSCYSDFKKIWVTKTYMEWKAWAEHQCGVTMTSKSEYGNDFVSEACSFLAKNVL